jgi:hypothetical protein
MQTFLLKWFRATFYIAQNYRSYLDEPELGEVKSLSETTYLVFDTQGNGNSDKKETPEF